MHAYPTTQTQTSKFNKMVNEEVIQKAISDLESQETLNYAAIAKKYKITRTTLMRRHKGKTVSNHEARSIYQQLLTDEQENVLLEHISTLSSRGMPPTPQVLKNIVVEMVGHEIGQHWLSRFRQRHKETIKSVYLKGLDNSRKVADNSAHFEHFYTRVRVFLLNISS
jgi:Tc5 transposase DNA-binding domain